MYLGSTAVVRVQVQVILRPLGGILPLRGFQGNHGTNDLWSVQGSDPDLMGAPDAGPPHPGRSDAREGTLRGRPA
jgi:hypothetical protein